MCMKDLKEFVTIKMVDYDRKAITENFEIFVEKCDEIKKKRPELTAETLLPPQLVKSLPESIQYENTPQEFQAYRSSGDDNSCLYQSVSLLLSGTENLQCSLRLMTTLHAVQTFKMYKKQLLCGAGNWDAEHWKWFFRHHMNDQMIREIQKLEDSETIIDSCLKVLLMETACLGIDSSVLHVGFLCGAIGINIQQHFQYNTQYGYTSEVVPWIKHLLGESIDVTPGLDLHIFW
ncbi:uncharacterized protein LOC132752497, partial [Ruditapes philippinarum]|uniref:uncharacterized protein LOC132752497 n=1 Tax=Ruditapes philippinarum TaxID=129788 RepID=UPI00295A9373